MYLWVHVVLHERLGCLQELARQQHHGSGAVTNLCSYHAQMIFRMQFYVPVATKPSGSSDFILGRNN